MPRAENAWQKTLRLDAVDERVHRQPVDQEIAKGGVKSAAPDRPVDAYARLLFEPGPVTVDRSIDVHVRCAPRENEAEQLRKIALRCAERRQLPVVRAQPQLAVGAAETDVPRVEVVMNQGSRRLLEERPPLGNRVNG